MTTTTQDSRIEQVEWTETGIRAKVRVLAGLRFRRDYDKEARRWNEVELTNDVCVWVHIDPRGIAAGAITNKSHACRDGEMTAKFIGVLDVIPVQR